MSSFKTRRLAADTVEELRRLAAKATQSTSRQPSSGLQPGHPYCTLVRGFYLYDSMNAVMVDAVS